MKSAKKKNPDTDRKKEILEASLECFLEFGYSKTSMEDIAKQAGLSRPLLYLVFKSKEDIFQDIFEFLMEDQYPEAEALMKTILSDRDKLFRLCEILLLEPWARLSGHPMSREFYETCSKLSPQSVEKYENLILKCLKSIFGNKEKAEIFRLALDGMSADIPSSKTLRKRVFLLAEQFSK